MIKTETRLSVSDSMLERLLFVVTRLLLAMLLICYLSACQYPNYRILHHYKVIYMYVFLSEVNLNRLTS